MWYKNNYCIYDPQSDMLTIKGKPQDLKYLLALVDYVKNIEGHLQELGVAPYKEDSVVIVHQASSEVELRLKATSKTIYPMLFVKNKLLPLDFIPHYVVEPEAGKEEVEFFRKLMVIQWGEENDKTFFFVEEENNVTEIFLDKNIARLLLPLFFYVSLLPVQILMQYFDAVYHNGV